MVIMRDIFNTWVNNTFNDHYLLTNHFGNMLIFKHEANTNNEVLWNILVDTYGEPCEVMATNPDIVFGFDGGKELSLTPFDNYFRNTADYKGVEREKVKWEN